MVCKHDLHIATGLFHFVFQTSTPTPDSGTLHFKLSNMGNHHPSPSDLQQRTTAADFLTHNGPECYIKPQTKSNRRIIRNALCHVCLAGEVNMTVKQRALAVSAQHHMYSVLCIQASMTLYERHTSVLEHALLWLCHISSGA